MADKWFKVDARAVISLGRDSIKDHVTAVVELVKNSYDAGATIVEIEFRLQPSGNASRHIRIADNGVGMNDADIGKKWLRIGFSEKRTAKRIGSRRRLGEKGVGRLSADRLGSKLRLSSQARNKPSIGITIDWSRFERSGVDISNIRFRPLKKVTFAIPQPSEWREKERSFGPKPEDVPNTPQVTGTELLITNLRQTWSEHDLSRLRFELGQLINPFEKRTGFQIRLLMDLAQEHAGILESPSLMDGEIEGVFQASGDTVVISQQTRSEKSANLDPVRIEHRYSTFLEGKSRDLLPPKIIGPVTVRIRLYTLGENLTNRDTKSLLARFLKENAGVRVYRDGIRVLPYGDQQKAEGDWLELAHRKATGRAAPKRADWRIEPSRIVGSVEISRDHNRELLDAAGREGLIANDAFAQLKQFTLACVRHLELEYHKIRLAAEDSKPNTVQPQKVLRSYSRYLNELKRDLSAVAKVIPEGKSAAVDALRERISAQSKRSAELGKSLKQLVEQTLTYRGLATLGIAHASFGHEVQLSAGQFLDAAYAATLELDPPPDVAAAKCELEKAIRHGEHISTWGRYTLTRVKAAKRQLIEEDLDVVLMSLISEMKAFFLSSSIELKPRLVEPVTCLLVVMDFESLVINLLTNAYDFLKDSPRSPRIVEVELRNLAQGERWGFQLQVSDSGPGVAEHIREDIWQPLFTTKGGSDKKPTGTGLGLSIVDAIVQEFGGTRKVDTDPALGGARFSIWLPHQKDNA